MFLGAGAQGSNFLIQLMEIAPQGARQCLAFFGQGNIARVADKQIEAELLLKPLDLLTNGGGCLVQLLGRQLEAAPAGRTLEIQQSREAAQGLCHIT